MLLRWNVPENLRCRMLAQLFIDPALHANSSRHEDIVFGYREVAWNDDLPRMKLSALLKDPVVVAPQKQCLEFTDISFCKEVANKYSASYCTDFVAPTRK